MTGAEPRCAQYAPVQPVDTLLWTPNGDFRRSSKPWHCHGFRQRCPPTRRLTRDSAPHLRPLPKSYHQIAGTPTNPLRSRGSPRKDEQYDSPPKDRTTGERRSRSISQRLPGDPPLVGRRSTFGDVALGQNNYGRYSKYPARCAGRGHHAVCIARQAKCHRSFRPPSDQPPPSKQKNRAPCMLHR